MMDLDNERGGKNSPPGGKGSHMRSQLGSLIYGYEMSSNKANSMSSECVCKGLHSQAGVAGKARYQISGVVSCFSSNDFTTQAGVLTRAKARVAGKVGGVRVLWNDSRAKPWALLECVRRGFVKYLIIK